MKRYNNVDELDQLMGSKLNNLFIFRIVGNEVWWYKYVKIGVCFQTILFLQQLYLLRADNIPYAYKRQI